MKYYAIFNKDKEVIALLRTPPKTIYESAMYKSIRETPWIIKSYFEKFFEKIKKSYDEGLVKKVNKANLSEQKGSTCFVDI